MIQNHLLQLVCVIAMECPKEYEAERIRDAKTRVMKSVKPYAPDQVFKSVVRGQYTEGDINGVERPGYREEANRAGITPKIRVRTSECSTTFWELLRDAESKFQPMFPLNLLP